MWVRCCCRGGCDYRAREMHERRGGGGGEWVQAGSGGVQIGFEYIGLYWAGLNDEKAKGKGGEGQTCPPPSLFGYC